MSKARRALSFRYKLTLWYIGIFSLSLVVYETLNYYELKANLISQVDQTLSSAMTQAIQNLDIENGNLAFQNVEKTPVQPLSPTQTTVLIRVLDEKGGILHKSVSFPNVPIDAKALAAEFAAAQSNPGDHAKISLSKVGPPKSPSIQTFREDKTGYRVLTTVFAIPSLGKWNAVQIAESTSKIDDELASFIFRFLVGLPFILIIAALGGLFLANTALKPIAAMRNLAGSVREDHLSDRIDYEGPDDEFGKLAAEFDSMLARLETSFKREKRFSADASHELKTPLTALKGKLDVALSRPRTSKEYLGTLLSMRSDVERLISLTQDLLLLSRMGMIALASRAEKVELAELVDSCVDQILIAFPDKKISIKRAYSKPSEVWGIRDYLARLFLNILDNAVKFSEEAPEISIRVRSLGSGKIGQSRDGSGSAFAVEISDRGPGIPQDKIPSLFEPFYRVEDDRSRMKGGSGLGLAIAKEIAELHGGSIEIASSPGEGTSVTVFLTANPENLPPTGP